MHLLAGVPGRVDLRARVAGLGLIVTPLLVAFVSVLALITRGRPDLPAALGTAVAGFAVSAAVASVVSVFAPYALPDSANPFAMNRGTAGAKGLLAFAGMVASMALAAPVLVVARLVPRQWSVLTLAVALGWGAVVLVGATAVAGRRLDLRAPEVLSAVTPNR